MFKRYFSVVLAAVMLISILSACSGGGKSTSGTEAGLEKEAPEGEVSGEITVASWNLAADSLTEEAENFMKKYPKAKVKIEYVTSDYNSITPPLTSGKGAPDIMQIQQRDFPNFLDVFEGQFVDLTARLDGKESEFAEVALNLVKDKDGKVMALPWDLGPVGIYYRKDMFEKAGVDPASLTTWDKFIEEGKKIQEANGVKMLALGMSSKDIAEMYRMLMNQLGAQYYDEDGNIKFVTEENIQAVNMFKKMVDAGLVVDAPTWDDRIRAFANDQIATAVYPVWYAGSIKTQAEDQKGKWGIMPMPAFTEGGPNQSHSGGSVLAISSQSENKELAWKFIEYTLMTNEGQDVQMKYGLFPSWQPYYETEKFKEVDDYFGIALSEFFGKLSTDIPTLDYGSNFMDVNDTIVGALGEVIDGKDVEEALKAAEEKAARETGLEISK
ncbi:ABC transporter substrate-binding protein [Mesobacillus foraminis]|uniref:Lactose/L-arabinose transport system substrate-binding protein n=1 Tax=Mesobacillus foraminis TaxID=279826 RepID=A0A4R2BLM1_9BACI|nr:sugar ABC transporter substrate-binding protein [Mesobacillus foraminis]TCN28157.1 lactose/L-arabinose transport system substrate-binding protein [Mesobacillus foraminis]